MADRDVQRPGGPELVASFFTLTGAGFGQEPRHGFVARCEAAAATGFAGIGLHVDDLARNRDAGLGADGMRAVFDETGLRLVEIEFLGGWALDTGEAATAATVAGIEAVAGELGGRHVTAGEFASGKLVARVAGQEVLIADVMAGNAGMLGMLRRLGLPARRESDGDTVTITPDLTALELPPDRFARARGHLARAGIDVSPS